MSSPFASSCSIAFHVISFPDLFLLLCLCESPRVALFVHHSTLSFLSSFIHLSSQSVNSIHPLHPSHSNDASINPCIHPFHSTPLHSITCHCIRSTRSFLICVHTYTHTHIVSIPKPQARIQQNSTNFRRSFGPCRCWHRRRPPTRQPSSCASALWVCGFRIYDDFQRFGMLRIFADTSGNLIATRKGRGRCLEIQSKSSMSGCRESRSKTPMSMPALEEI